MPDDRQVWAQYANYQVVETRGRYRIEDTSDGSVSAPIDWEVAKLLIEKPSRLLDLQLACETPRNPEAPASKPGEGSN